MLVSHPAMGPRKLVCISVCRAHCASFCVLEIVWRLQQGHEEGTESEPLFGESNRAANVCNLVCTKKHTNSLGLGNTKKKTQVKN